MPIDSMQPVGRRERNKNDKLSRITAAAKELFAQHGVGSVTTQQVADAADVASGTVFLYAKTKAELLLLAQNAEYAMALGEGVEEAAGKVEILEALLALWLPIIKCNRKHVENGRAYLREVLFGAGDEPNHKQALQLMLQTEAATAECLTRFLPIESAEARVRAQLISAATLLLLASPANVELTLNQLENHLASQIKLAIGT